MFNTNITAVLHSGQGHNISAVVLLEFESVRETRPSHCKHGVCPLLQARAKARIDGDEATAAVIVVWCRRCRVQATRMHSKLSPVASGRMRVRTGTAGSAGPDFLPSHRDKA